MKNLSELWDFFQMKYLYLINKYVGMECTFECAIPPIRSSVSHVHGESQSRDPSRSRSLDPSWEFQKLKTSFPASLGVCITVICLPKKCSSYLQYNMYNVSMGWFAVLTIIFPIIAFNMFLVDLLLTKTSLKGR